MQHSYKIALVSTLLLSCNFLSACGGLNRDIELQPLAPVLTDPEARVVKERGGYWRIEMADVEFRVFSVELSSKTTWVFGPFIAFPTLGLGDEIYEEGALVIGLRAKAENKVSVAFDPSEFTVLLEDGRSLKPSRIRVRDQEEMELKPVEPISLLGPIVWIRLEYDEPLPGLQPFTLRLDSLQLNGETLDLPPLSFVRNKAYSGS